MPTEKKTLASNEIWRTAWTTLRSTAKQTLILLIFGLVLPQILLNLVLDVQSSEVVAQLRAIFTSKMASTDSPVAFRHLLAPALAYFGRLGACIILMSLLYLASFLGLVQTAIDHHRQLPSRGSWHAWLAGLRSTIPAAFIMGLTLVILVIFGQVFIAPALVVAILGMLIPVILIAEGQGAWRTLWSALTMKYAQGSGFSSWAVFFNLISLSAFFYTGLAAIGLLSDAMLVLDERTGLVRQIWSYSFNSKPFGPVYLAVALIECALSMTLLTALPALTAALYFTVRRGGGGRPIARA